MVLKETVTFLSLSNPFYSILTYNLDLDLQYLQEFSGIPLKHTLKPLSSRT